MSKFAVLLSSGPLFKAPLAQAFYEYGVKFLFCVIAMIVGINLGKVLRAKKDGKKEQ